MRILVTGASGLLGLNLALTAAKRHTVFGQVHSHPLHTTAFTVLKADLLAPGAVAALLEQTRPDCVIHCAALANLDACEANPAQAQQLNTEIPAQLAEHVARGGARRGTIIPLIHVSTDAVFDGQGRNYREEDLPNPLGVYAQTKLAAEEAVAAVNPQAIIARVVFFGWSLSGRRSLAEFFVNNLSQGKPVMGFTNVVFCPLLVNDLVNIFFQMLEKGLSGLYHVVSRESLSKYEFGVRIARRFGFSERLITPSELIQGGPNAHLSVARSPHLSLCTDKLAQALGQPLPGVSPAIDRFYTLYQQGYPQYLQHMGKVLE